jgi:hypothetical protein
MAPKAAQKAAQKKAARQKKILIALSVPMLAALIYAYMTFSSLGAQPAAAAPTPAGQTTPVGSTSPPVTPSGSVTPDGSSTHVGTTLRSFVALGRKDPFHDGGPHANAGCGCKKGGSGHHPGGGSSKKPNPSPKGPSEPLTGAVISFNGKKLALALGNQFGHAPGLSGVSLFRLVHVTTQTAVVAVVGTTQQWTLHVNRPLILNQDGGWTYTLILEPAGSAAPMTAQPTTAS